MSEIIETGEYYREKIREIAGEKFPDSYLSEDLPHKTPVLNGFFHSEGGKVCPRCGKDALKIGEKYYCPPCIELARKDYERISGVREIGRQQLKDLALDLLADKVLRGDIQI